MTYETVMFSSFSNREPLLNSCELRQHRRMACTAYMLTLGKMFLHES
jgi:hypothetical protein